MRKTYVLLPVVAALLAICAGASESGQWRLAVLNRKLTGELPDLSWVDVISGLRLCAWGPCHRSLVMGDVTPARTDTDNLRAMGAPIWPSWIKPLDLPLEGSKEPGWRMYNIFTGSTANTKMLESHVSVLSAGKTPHSLHQHSEEEFLLVLSGGLEIITADGPLSQKSTVSRAGPRYVVYHPSGQYHTIRSIGPGPATYVVFKWQGDHPTAEQPVLGSSGFDLNQALVSPWSNPNQITFTPIFEFPTRYLRKLHCHVSILKPGAGYAPHDDPHDVAIVLLDGTVETLGQRVNRDSVIFYAADEPHGMKNVGTTPAIYVVFEFHGSHGSPEGSGLVRGASGVAVPSQNR